MHVNEENSTMKHFVKMAVVAVLLGGSLAAVMPEAQAGVSVSVGIGNRLRPAYWYGPPGPCASYHYSYGAPWRNCGYPYWHDPIFVDGRWYHGPFYYHNYRGQRWYWWRGAWRRDEWRGGPGAWRGKVQWGDRDNPGNGK
jgi:hypothetical protein